MPTTPRFTKGKEKPRRKRARPPKRGPKGPRGKPNAGSLTELIVDLAEVGADEGTVKPDTVAMLRMLAEKNSGKKITVSLIYKARRFMSKKTLRRLFPHNR
jgi:hypothetical protein